jgi:dethiobiotin synthetase
MYPTVVVSRHYLGSINHTLLTLEALKSRGIPVAGVLFNGDELPDTERIITTLGGGVRSLGTIPNLEAVNSQMIAVVGENLRGALKQLLL